VATRPTRTISLFSGIGALDLAIGRVFPDARCLLYLEREIPSVATLAARMESGELDAAPVWSDVRTVPTNALRGRVDLVAGGFPCQDISLAGKGAGLGGERSGLFFDLMRVVRDVRPAYVFLENVSAITVRGLDAVLGTLAESGFDAEWGCLKASDVGATHSRDRWWLLAWDREQLADASWGGFGERRQNDNARPYGGEVWRHATRCCAAVADAIGGRYHGRASEPWGQAQRGTAVARPGQAVGDADHAGLEGRSLCGFRCPDEWPARTACRPSRDWPGFPPGPDDRDGWRDYLACDPDLAPAIEPEVRRGVDGASTRVDRLRGLGNAVVPQQAEAALRALWFRAFGEWP
jgi:DNA (cytosine-5)-methyltransferase 1